MLGLSAGLTRGTRDWGGAGGAPRRAVLAAIIALELILLYILLDGGAWIYDDNLILALARRSGFTWAWLTSPIFQHWGIGYHFVFSVLQRLMPIDYRWVLAGMLVLLGASIYLIDRIFSLMFGAGRLALVIATYFGLTILFIRPLQWFAGGLQALPSTFFDLLCLYGYLRFVSEGSRRWVVVSAGALAAGFLFYEKPAFMLLYLPLLRWLFMSERLHPREFARTLWRERPMWAALVAVAALWAIGYRHYGGGSGLAAGSVSLSQYLQFFRILWAQTLIPASVGLTLPQAGLDAGQVTLAVALQILALATLALSVRRKSSAWRAWLFLVICVLVTGVLVARSRIPQFGVGIGGDLRYLLDFAWLLPLTAGFAFSARSTVWPRLNGGRSMPGSVRPSRLAAALTAGVLVGYCAVSVITAAKLQREWPGPAARAWENHLRSGLASVESGRRHVVVADDAGPFIIVEPAFSPYNLLSRIIPLYDSRAQVDGILDGALVRIDPGGGVHRAGVAVGLGGGDARSLLRSRQLTIRGAVSVVPGATGLCVSAGRRRAIITRSMVDRRLAAAPPYYLRVRSAAGRPAKLSVLEDAGSGYAPVSAGQLSIGRHAATSILFVGSIAPHRLRLAIDPGNTLCISHIDLVALRSLN